MKKYPILLPYIHTSDKGMELRYSLRSWHNIENWDGTVVVVGDKEAWFNNIIHMPFKRTRGKPYLDQVKKMRAGSLLPGKFIAMMDDLYITEPIVATVYCRAEPTGQPKSYHDRTKAYTSKKLQSMGLPTVDYETHAPMLVETDKLLETLDTILMDEKSHWLQWRSMYGNMHQIDAEPFEDKKTKTAHLKDGPIISTSWYTDELNTLFPEPSKFEVVK